MIRKCKWEELEIGKTYYYEMIMNDGLDDMRTIKYFPVVVVDITEKKVIYKWKNDTWKEYINKSQWSEVYLFIDDEQETLL